MKKRFLLILCIFALLFGCAMVASAATYPIALVLIVLASQLINSLMLA